jgi:hypothetical protein
MVIQEQIMESLKLCHEAGREPLLIIMNPNTFAGLLEDLDSITKLIPLMPPQTLFGMPIEIRSDVTDFFIVDKRSWAEQKF